MLQNEIGKERYEAAALLAEREEEEEEEDTKESEDEEKREKDDAERPQQAHTKHYARFNLPVAMEYPIKLDRAVETRTIVLPQLCMQGYALDDCERAMEELQSTDLYGI